MYFKVHFFLYQNILLIWASIEEEKPDGNKHSEMHMIIEVKSRMDTEKVRTELYIYHHLIQYWARNKGGVG